MGKTIMGVPTTVHRALWVDVLEPNGWPPRELVIQLAGVEVAVHPEYDEPGDVDD